MKKFDELYNPDGTYKTDESYTEIIKLHKMLNDAKIPHEFKKFTDGWQIIYPEDGEKRVMDAVQNFGSYGSEDNLLEIMGLLTPEEAEYDIVAGHLTAQGVFKRIKAHWDDRGAVNTERLTYMDGGKWRIRFGDTEYTGRKVDQIAAYEDTGLEPEEIKSLWAEWMVNLKALEDFRNLDIPISRLRELAKADREGLCVILPVKVGNKVWFTKFMWNYAKRPISAMVCGIKTFSSSGSFTFTALTDENNISRSFTNGDIGKTVFLTLEEAERALEEYNG